MKYKVAVYETIMISKVVAILRNIDVSKSIALSKALVDGGITAMEVTMDTPNALEAISKIREYVNSKVVVGAGTVLDEQTARAALLAGAEFLVAPNFNENVIRLGNRYGRIVMPGCMTVSEIEKACEAGADIIKVFPALTVGASFFKQVKGPLSHVTLMATGGVGTHNGKDFFDNGADILGVGGSLMDRNAISSESYWKITDYAQKLTNLS